MKKLLSVLLLTFGVAALLLSANFAHARNNSFPGEIVKEEPKPITFEVDRVCLETFGRDLTFVGKDANGKVQQISFPTGRAERRPMWLFSLWLSNANGVYARGIDIRRYWEKAQYAELKVSEAIYNQIKAIFKEYGDEFGSSHYENRDAGISSDAEVQGHYYSNRIFYAW
ncbi:MAG: hypothetical protein NTZ80_03885 [Patescibacteria group bacterium]|nr:hypothetical protein [Patescibacteria group bacterium]